MTIKRSYTETKLFFLGFKFRRSLIIVYSNKKARKKLLSFHSELNTSLDNGNLSIANGSFQVISHVLEPLKHFIFHELQRSMVQWF